MLVYSRKWEDLRRSQIPLLMSWHNLRCSSGLLLAERVLVFPQDRLPSPRCRSNNLPLREICIRKSRGPPALCRV